MVDWHIALFCGHMDVQAVDPIAFPELDGGADRFQVMVELHQIQGTVRVEVDHYLIILSGFDHLQRVFQLHRRERLDDGEGASNGRPLA